MWTDKYIKGLSAKNKVYRVTEALGQKGSGKLMLEIEPNGTKSFFFQQYIKTEDGSRRQLIKIGRYRDKPKALGFTLSAARDAALGHAKTALEHGSVKAHLVDQEKTARLAKQKQDSANICIQEALDTYLAHKDLKAGTVLDYKKAIKETFGDEMNTPMASITRDVIIKLYRQRSSASPARANNAMRVFRAIYNFQRAITRTNDGQYLLPENPTHVLREAKITKKINRRKTYIPKEELEDWFEGVLSLSSNFPSGSILSDYYIFLLLTGARREEARQLKRKDVNLTRGIFKLTDTKNREVVEIPMSSPLKKLFAHASTATVMTMFSLLPMKTNLSMHSNALKII